MSYCTFMPNELKVAHKKLCRSCTVCVVYTVGQVPDKERLSSEDFPKNCPYYTNSREEAYHAVYEWRLDRPRRLRNFLVTLERENKKYYFIPDNII